MSTDEALENAKRLLQVAEGEIDLAKMQRYESLADSWISIARILVEREQNA